MVYDDVGNILTEEWSHDSGKGNVYTYDKAYRLTKALIRSVDPSAELASPGSQAYANKLEYNLSDDSDRTSLVLTPYGQSAVTTSYTSNNVHEYTVVGGINRVYDSNGNLIDDGTNDFEYDYRNQIVRVTRQSDSSVIGEYEYDALGRRTRKTLEDSSEIRWYHDGVHEIEEFNENGVLLRKFVYRDDIDSISMMEAPDQADVDGDFNTSELKRFYFHYDGRTNVSRLTDNDEQIVESYETDPYGAVSIKDQGGSPVSVSAVGNPFTFQRRRLDDETGLYYFRARYYDPIVGQWLQRDPLGFPDSGNSREFVVSNPVTRVDPLGTDSPGCDGIPNALETPCIKNCCASHDACYATYKCGMTSWLSAPSADCQKCNLAVLACIHACRKGLNSSVALMIGRGLQPIDVPAPPDADNNTLVWVNTPDGTGGGYIKDPLFPGLTPGQWYTWAKKHPLGAFAYFLLTLVPNSRD